MKKLILKSKVFYIVLILLFLKSSVYSYSLFSSQGNGEAITAPGLLRIGIPKEWNLEIGFLGELVNISQDATKVSNFDFTIPYVNWQLPLPKGFGLNAGLEELFNLNFDISSAGEQVGTDSIYKQIQSKGSVSMLRLSGKKNFFSFSTIEFGGFMTFGSAQEIWTNNFVDLEKSFYDTLQTNFSGAGLIAGIGLEAGNFEAAINYYSKTDLQKTVIDTVELPARTIASLNYNIFQDLDIGIGFENWAFSQPHTSLNKLSILTEFGRKPKFLLGCYNKQWYHKDITEKGGLLGINVSLKSLCKLGLNVEYGQREYSNLKEEVYRFYLSINGSEDF